MLLCDVQGPRQEGADEMEWSQTTKSVPFGWNSGAGLLHLPGEDGAGSHGPFGEGL